MSMYKSTPTDHKKILWRRIQIGLFCLSILAGVLGLSQKAWTGPAAPSLVLMASLGDSVTAGTMSDTTLKKDSGSTEQEPRYTTIEQALRAHDERAWKENKATLAWASGNQVVPHSFRFNEYITRTEGIPAEIANLSVPGALTSGLKVQVDQLLQLVASGKYKDLRYVTLLIGHNDACAAPPVPLESVKKDLLTTFERIASIQQSEKIRILVAGIPKIPELGRKEIRDLPTFGILTCNSLVNMTGICKRMVHWKDEAEYKTLVQEIVGMNALLKSVVDEANAAHKNLDVVFTNYAFDVKLDAGLLAADCFHPNKKGQKEISEVLWREQPWFK